MRGRRRPTLPVRRRASLLESPSAASTRRRPARTTTPRPPSDRSASPSTRALAYFVALEIARTGRQSTRADKRLQWQAALSANAAETRQSVRGSPDRPPWALRRAARRREAARRRPPLKRRTASAPADWF